MESLLKSLSQFNVELLLGTLVLLAVALFVDARTMLRGPEGDFRYAGIGVPGHHRNVDAAAPSKTWESPSLHQSIRQKAPPATASLLDGSARPGPAASIDHSGHIARESTPRLRLISPRAPPLRSIAL